jgi:hypothetical protein
MFSASVTPSFGDINNFSMALFSECKIISPSEQDVFTLEDNWLQNA